MQRTHRTALIAVAGVCGMTGLGFASVPLYNLFCEATGLNGTTNRADAAPGATGKKITVAFDSNVSPKLAWAFKPEVEQTKVDIGARDMEFFTATNRSDRPITGTATYNVSPAQAGKYFTKIECFCFTEQTLKPGETVRMPVIFFVDPKIKDDPDARDIDTITLSYTFYPVEKKG
ncbi:cytochrome c oxidase assembly protein [uncultured Sphingomonas sp.]|uniref:cytochrome c oxidase assembly protein n=1 Tax=uncultured Sphingomonas sp. TaxID=158754 RepID=UPI0025DAEC36|nr:cytochrome c oxidase assembly protein [uncultured Sphingomonas sp.]